MTHLIEQLESIGRDWCQIHELSLNSRGVIASEQGREENEERDYKGTETLLCERMRVYIVGVP